MIFVNFFMSIFFRIRFDVFEFFVKFLKERKFIRRFSFYIFYHFIIIVYFFRYIIVNSNELSCRKLFFSLFFFNFRRISFSSIFTQLFFWTQNFYSKKIYISFLLNHKYNLPRFRKFRSLSTKHSRESKNKRSRLN